jgi:glucose 1-dehydrogenase
MKLDGKVALVTGGSQGIGQAIAIRLAAAGANVSFNYHSNPDGAAETLKKLEESGSQGLMLQADTGSLADVRRLVAETIGHFGKLDILVNNAGVEKNADFWDVTEADYDAVMNVNLKGVFFTIQEFVKHLRQTQQPGKVINISSVHEELPFPHFAAYCASKGGLKMLTRDLAVELAPYGININNVAPGAIETPINTNLANNPEQLAAVLKNIPLGRLGKPNDVAAMVAFLASAEADYITGATFVVDGGLLWNYQEQ